MKISFETAIRFWPRPLKTVGAIVVLGYLMKWPYDIRALLILGVTRWLINLLVKAFVEITSSGHTNEKDHARATIALAVVMETLAAAVSIKTTNVSWTMGYLLVAVGIMSAIEPNLRIRIKKGQHQLQNQE